MNSSVILSTEEIKQIIADFFGISPKDIIKMQYSFAVKGMSEGEVAFKLSELNGSRGNQL